MQIKLSKVTATPDKAHKVLLFSDKSGLKKYGFSKEELTYINNQIQPPDKQFAAINRYSHWIFIQFIEQKKENYKTLEAYRKAACSMLPILNSQRIKEISVVDMGRNPQATQAFTEGLILSNYQFLKYKSDKEKEVNVLQHISIESEGLSTEDIQELKVVTQATCIARTLVNEPVDYLTAVQLSKEIERLGKEAGFHVEVFHKTKIESLKMGGLLAVNKGSIDPPTFSILQWKPAKAKNKAPYVLVGKGIVFDTGGLSLKPTLNSMDSMKCDMAGAAAVTGAIYAIAKAKLPVHVVGLIPATDNRPGGNAYVPSDVITLHNGKTVEVLNTDAEGRLILGDALSYAQKYKPELVIDLATLTGSAVAAIGFFGSVMMGTASEEVKNLLKQSGNNMYERLAEMPFWEEYDDLIKSDVADIKNVGGPYGGSITAGKFLAHFINYPWIHLDIAGPAFLDKADSYRGKGGTGVGVRLLFDFFKRLSLKK